MGYLELAPAFISGFSIGVALSAELYRRTEIADVKNDIRKLGEEVEDINHRIYHLKLDMEREKKGGRRAGNE